jgi:hypothetical protein
MVKRHGRATDFIHKCFAAHLKFLQVRRAGERIRRARKNEIGYGKITHRATVGRGERINFLRDSQRRFAHFIGRPGIADDCGINSDARYYKGVVADFPTGSTRKTGRDHDVGIGRADQEAIFF